MTIHACRDLRLGGFLGYSSGSYDTMWALNAFMQGVLLYKYQSSAGNIPPPAYAAFTASYPGPSSSYVTLNQGSCIITGVTSSLGLTGSLGQAAVVISKDAYNLSTTTGNSLGEGPVGLWLAIRSNSYPLANSGLFVITSASLSANTLYIDYRTTSSLPPAETTQMLTCSFWLPSPGSDNVNVDRTGATYAQFEAMAGNGNANQYQSQGTSTQARLILTSPDPSAYQVRLCLENLYDREYGGNGGYGTPSLTVMPGFSGSAGDFPNMTYSNPNLVAHLHAPQWFNSYSLGPNGEAELAGTLCGHDLVNVAGIGEYSGGYTTRHGFYAWGNDQTGTCVILTHGVPFIESGSLNQGATHDVMTAFGIPEDETVPLVTDNVQRLFVIGQSQVPFNGINWANGSYTNDGVTGVAFSLNNRLGPISCVMSSYVYATNQESDANGIRFDAAAADTPYLGASELLSVDLIAGTLGGLYDSSQNYNLTYSMEPRRLGRFPIARQGRAVGQPNWSTVDPALQWFHVTNGFYLPWGGIAGE